MLGAVSDVSACRYSSRRSSSIGVEQSRKVVSDGLRQTRLLDPFTQVKGVTAEVKEMVTRVWPVVEEFVVVGVCVRRFFQQRVLPLKTPVLVFPCLTEHGSSPSHSPAGRRKAVTRPQAARRIFRQCRFQPTTRPSVSPGQVGCSHGCQGQQTATNAQVAVRAVLRRVTWVFVCRTATMGFTHVCPELSAMATKMRARVSKFRFSQRRLGRPPGWRRGRAGPSQPRGGRV